MGFPPTNYYPPTDPADFSELGFAIGVVRGARTWRSSEDGWLAGMVYKQIWLPGENIALCRRHVSPVHPQQQYPNPPGNPKPGPVSAVARFEDPPHPDFKVPERNHLPDCRCGFYAYYDGSNDYHLPRKDANDPRMLVQGMVEGYGECVIGPRGFRCTKATIVALCLPVDYPNFVSIMEHYPGIPIFHDFKVMEYNYPNEDGGANEPRKAIEA